MDKYILSEVCYQNGYQDGYKNGYKEAIRWKNPKTEPPSVNLACILLKFNSNTYQIESPEVLLQNPDYCIGWREIIN